MHKEILCEGRNLEQEICKYIGETVTIFTTSGGVSGCGFTGVVLSVNRNLVRLITQPGIAPAYPLGNTGGRYGRYSYNNRGCRIGSVTDIPINRISAFVHNAV